MQIRFRGGFYAPHALSSISIDQNEKILTVLRLYLYGAVEEKHKGIIIAAAVANHKRAEWVLAVLVRAIRSPALAGHLPKLWRIDSGSEATLVRHLVECLQAVVGPNATSWYNGKSTDNVIVEQMWSWKNKHVCYVMVEEVASWLAEVYNNMDPRDVVGT